VKVLLAGEIDDSWRRELAAACPEAMWVDGDADAEAAVVANPPHGALAGLQKLRLIQSLWAGVDRLLRDPTLPTGVPIARMVDPLMGAAMAETALWATLSLHRGFFVYAGQQRQGLWRQHAQRRAGEVNVLVLGQGEMGHAAAARIAQQGYAVSGWRRDAPLAPLLATHGIVINLLPLTPQTTGLLDAAFFAALPPGAAIVNLGRGAHVVDADLLAALDSGRLGHAVLDVFHHEPLPAEHAFWRHPLITLLPHAAALTDPRSASAVVAANLRALQAGAPLLHRVDRQRGY
jgi:glyoxylate/hydroxypyruvate reductase A